MALVAGIDEAGLGPVLGPLVVAATAFEAPDEAVDTNMWRLLAGTVSRKPSRKRRQLPIADSKKLYNPAAGVEHLERAVLAMLACDRHAPRNLAELLELLCPRVAERLPAYPWYPLTEARVPHVIDPAELPLWGNSLNVNMRRARTRFLGLRAEPVLAGEFNRLVGATNNKSRLVLDVVCRLLMHLWRLLPPGESRIFIDRQGGRRQYLPTLQRLLPGRGFRVLDERDTLSAYRITDGDRIVELHFCVRGDDDHLPVALASMTAKYVRELFMHQFNRFWTARMPSLKATAGYFGDGQRFFREIRALVTEMGVDEQWVYRSR